MSLAISKMYRTCGSPTSGDGFLYSIQDTPSLHVSPTPSHPVRHVPSPFSRASTSLYGPSFRPSLVFLVCYVPFMPEHLVWPDALVPVAIYPLPTAFVPPCPRCMSRCHARYTPWPILKNLGACRGPWGEMREG